MAPPSQSGNQTEVVWKRCLGGDVWTRMGLYSGSRQRVRVNDLLLSSLSQFNERLKLHVCHASPQPRNQMIIRLPARQRSASDDEDDLRW